MTSNSMVFFVIFPPLRTIVFHRRCPVFSLPNPNPPPASTPSPPANPSLSTTIPFHDLSGGLATTMEDDPTCLRVTHLGRLGWRRVRAALRRWSERREWKHGVSKGVRREGAAKVSWKMLAEVFMLCLRYK